METSLKTPMLELDKIDWEKTDSLKEKKLYAFQGYSRSKTNYQRNLVSRAESKKRRKQNRSNHK